MAIETSLWSWIRSAKKYYGAQLQLQRIESGGTRKGIPDLFVCCEGVSFWVEGKTTSDLSHEQHIWHKEHAKAGGVSFILYTDKKANKVWYRYRLNPVPIIAYEAVACIKLMKLETITFRTPA